MVPCDGAVCNLLVWLGLAVLPVTVLCSCGCRLDCIGVQKGILAACQVFVVFNGMAFKI